MIIEHRCYVPQVPYMETSAKTNENVAAVFTQLVEATVKLMAVQVTACSRRADSL